MSLSMGLARGSIFAVIGMHLFEEAYRKSESNELLAPDASFKSFGESFLTVFQASITRITNIIIINDHV